MDKVHFSTGKDDWETPQWLFNQLDDEFHFTLDPCCTAENAKCRKYYTKAENGHEVGTCSHCLHVRIVDNYCPNCGAKMDGGNC